VELIAIKIFELTAREMKDDGPYVLRLVDRFITEVESKFQWRNEGRGPGIRQKVF
jgi:hypothetical protein